MRLSINELMRHYLSPLELRCIVCDLVIEDISHKFFVNLEFWFVVSDEIGHFIYEDYNILTKMTYLDHGSGDF